MAKRSHAETVALEPDTDAWAANVGDYDKAKLIAHRTKTLSRALHFNGKAKKALALAEEALAVLPEDEELKAQIASWKSES